MNAPLPSEKHFNGLTPMEAELLAILSEECGEVVQIVGKILRHGLSSYHPSKPDGLDNRRMLEKELGDVRAATALLNEHYVLNEDAIRRHRDEKMRLLPRYLHHTAVPEDFREEDIPQLRYVDFERMRETLRKIAKASESFRPLCMSALEDVQHVE